MKKLLVLFLLVVFMVATVFPWSLNFRWSGMNYSLNFRWSGMNYSQVTDKSYDVLYLLSATSQVLATLAGFVFSASIITAQLSSTILPRSLPKILGKSTGAYFLLFLASIYADLWFIAEPDNELGVRIAFILSSLSMLFSIPYTLSLVHRVDPVWWVKNLENEANKLLRSNTDLSSQLRVVLAELTELGKRAVETNQRAAFIAVQESLTSIGLNTKDEQQSVTYYVIECIRDLGMNCVKNPLMPLLPLDDLKILLYKAWYPKEGHFIFDFYSYEETVPSIGGIIIKTILDIGISAYEINNFNATRNSFLIVGSMIETIEFEYYRSKNKKDDSNEILCSIFPYYIKVLLPYVINFGEKIASGKDEETICFVALKLYLISLQSYRHEDFNNFNMSLNGIYEMAINSQLNLATELIRYIWIIGIASYTDNNSPYTRLVLEYLIRFSDRQNGKRLVNDGYKISNQSCPFKEKYEIDNNLRLAIWRDYKTALRQLHSENSHTLENSKYAQC